MAAVSRFLCGVVEEGEWGVGEENHGGAQSFTEDAGGLGSWNRSVSTMEILPRRHEHHE